MSLRLRYWILLIITALFLVVLIQNTEPVTLQILFWSVSMSLIILVLILLVLGFLLGYFSHMLFARGRAASAGQEKTPGPSGGSTP